MKLFFSLFVSIFFVFAIYQTNAQIDNINTWAGAKWIAMEEIPDSLKLVPGLHGLKKKNRNGYKTRSMVPVFRKKFEVDKSIKNATINISGLGHYELHVNGTKIGNRFLSPGWSNYNKRQFYNTYDITKNLGNGENVIGVIVGNGFYNINNERYWKLVIAYGYP
ncbi:MAG: alpha-L-rhamnosidase N-terminal domain-containing protein, partial [Bacteroidetes bacterium]|nr:alpha-L-rhamnosidase N-terminal domain-containing protein [Bacteroidota bacterium]